MENLNDNSRSNEEGMSKNYSAEQITELLRAWSQGDAAALNELTALVYDELHRRAHNRMRQERAGHSLQTADLVNEVWLRLVGAQDLRWKGRAHFLAICSTMMRRILIDHARARTNQKNQKWLNQVSLDEALTVPARDAVELDYWIALDEALDALEEFAPRKARVVEMHFFAGSTFKEIAAALGLSEDAVQDDCKTAKNWLRWKLAGGVDDGK